MRPVNVLITAASRRVPLVQAFQLALRSLGRPGRVIAADVNPLSPAVHFADRAYQVPFATDPYYVSELLALGEAERIRLVVPTIDDELAIIGAADEAFTRRGAIVACSPAETSSLCNDKYATCRYLSARGVPAARSWLPDEIQRVAGSGPGQGHGGPAEPSAKTEPQDPAFGDLPATLFVKPRVGRGSVGAFPARNRRELSFFLEYVADPVVQEFLDGPEYTIDVLCDFNGRPLSIVPRERSVIRAGVIDRGRTVKSPALLSLAEETCRALRFAGPINIQCRMRGTQPVIFEINPRFSGGISLTIAAGADFPKMLVALAAGIHVEPVIGKFREDLWMTCYESSLFLDAARLSLPALAAQDTAEVA